MSRCGSTSRNADMFGGTDYGYKMLFKNAEQTSAGNRTAYLYNTNDDYRDSAYWNGYMTVVPTNTYYIQACRCKKQSTSSNPNWTPEYNWIYGNGAVWSASKNKMNIYKYGSSQDLVYSYSTSSSSWP